MMLRDLQEVNKTKAECLMERVRAEEELGRVRAEVCVAEVG